MNTAPRRGRPRRFPAPVQAEGELPMDDATEALEASEGSEAPVTPTKSLRPPMRKEYTLASAQQRADEILQHVGSLDEGVDEFYIDRSKIPHGWDMEWKTKAVLGAEDPAQMVGYARTGWEPVPSYMFPDMMPANWKGTTIERKGMILMMRPKQLTDMARSVDAKRAREAVKIREQQIASAPDGQFTRDHSQVRPKINKGYEPMPVPQD